ncbi:major facilitator superfamily domain-containing protein [Gautieria morchelliformis]|nr:major facilitator superfamily domain-containing protein [Gautieria morchelliformis]
MRSSEPHEGTVTSNDDLSEFGGVEGRKRLEKRLLWKIDLRMSILILIYVLNYVDRNNAAAARLRGFEKDLHLKGQEFATLLSILYVGYIIMQIPSNMMLNWLGKPSLYLPACMMVWGMISILTGITKNFVGALLTRFFLGFVEAAFFPGALFLLSKWYTRKELGLRTAMFYCGNLMSNAFGGLLAAGILNGMDGVLGQAAWRWLFFIEGSLTIFVAICAMFILPDFPATTRSLTPLERKLAQLRMAEDAGEGDEEDSSEDHNQWNGFTLAITDWKVWWLAFALLSQTVSLSFNAYFPTLAATLGFKSTTVTLLLTAPPWGFAAIVAFCNARHSDVTGERFWHIATPILVGILGFVISLCTMNTAARYIALFLEAQSYAGLIVLLAWFSNSIPRPPAKRAVALAVLNAWSQLGNIAGSYVWDISWGPTYRKSYGICIATAGLMVIMCFVFRQHLIHLNKKIEQKEAATGQKITFRYLY